MYNDENIKKLVEDALKNMDPNGEFFKNIVSQITDQIKDEQKKIKLNNAKDTLDNFEKKYNDIKIPKDTKTVIHDLNKKANTYLNDNSYLKDYISNRDKFIGVFDKITKDKIEKDLEELEKNYNEINNVIKSSDDKFIVSTEVEFTDEDCPNHYEKDICDKCEFADECKDEVSDTSNNISYTSYTSGWRQTFNEDNKPIGYLYFNFDSNNDQLDIHKQILDLYSILNLHSDEWDNWDLFHYDYNNKNFYLSVLIDDYTYNFDEEESEMIDNNKDDITSFIYTKPDDNLKMFSIYILNYSTKTNKLYDFIRIIITVPDEITEPDYNNYYINLEKYFSDKQRLINLIEDYTYTFINRFKVNNHIPVKTDEDMYVVLIGDIIRQIQDKINSQPISEPTKIEFKKEDTPDKTNSILDKLGIPHDEKGNVEIPISSDFISNRNSVIDKAFDCDKEEFTNEDCPNDYVEDICKKCEFNEECKEEYKKEEQEYDAYLEKLSNRHQIWDDDYWWDKIFDFFKGDSEDTFIKVNDDFIIYMSFKNKVKKNIEGSELYFTYKIDRNDLTITIIEADPLEGFDVSWVGKFSIMVDPIIDCDDKYEKMLSYKNMHSLISDLTIKMCENVEIDLDKDIYYWKNKNNFTHNNLHKAVTDIILECINYFYNNITDNDK